MRIRDQRKKQSGLGGGLNKNVLGKARISANYKFLNKQILDLQQRGASLSSTLDTITLTKVLTKMDNVVATDLAKVKSIPKVINCDRLGAASRMLYLTSLWRKSLCSSLLL